MWDFVVAHGSSVGFIATAIAALITGAFAWSTIRTNRELARKRATLDFFIKTETDARTLELWNEYEDGLAKLKQIGAPLLEAQDKAAYQKVRNYLNVFELLACGIQCRIMDETIARRFFRPIVLDGYFQTRELIHEINKKFGSEKTYSDFVALAKKWQG